MHAPLIRLADCCEIISGATPSTRVKRFWDGDIAWATPKDLSSLESKHLHATPQTLTQEGYDSCSAKLMPAGSVLFSSRAPIGHVAINTIPMCTNQGFKSFVPDAKRVSADYLYYWLKTNKAYLQSLGNGATFKEVSKATVSEVRIPLPPVAEQRRIAAILDKADALRAKRREAIAMLERLLQSVFLDMFGDPRLNPRGFPEYKLSEFYVNADEGTRCGPFGSALKKSEVTESGVPLWNMDNISSAGQTQLPFRAWVTEDKARELAGYGVLDGDILISRAGTVGKMCVARAGESASLITTNLIRLRLGQRLIPEFFVALMTHCKGRVGRLKTGPDGAFTHMSTSVLDALSFPYPPLDQQRSWVIRSAAIQKQKAQMENQLVLMTRQLESITTRLFSGAALT